MLKQIWDFKEDKTEAWLNLDTETGQGELCIRRQGQTQAFIETVKVDYSALLRLVGSIKTELVKVRFPKYTQAFERAKA